MNSDNDSHETAAVTYKDFLVQLGPIDKLLGSVSYSDIDSGDGKSQQPQQQQQQPVRASARVFKKMKFDQNLTASINSTSGTTTATTAIMVATTVVTTTTTLTTPTITSTMNITNCSNSSANNNTNNTYTNIVSNQNLLNDKKDDDNKQETITKTEINKKTVNTQWSFEEKNMFFEALNEHGKDFENIHIYMLARLKKKGIPDEHIKTKHQIRHFYYKTSSSFLRYLKISNKVPKTAQELYALINYGELRRKIGSVSKKNWPKLNELINNGSVALRIKGKTIRIKTPMCRALRRLNQLDEKYDGLKLPTRVLVELRPKNMSAFLKVQSMAQNPRIKLAISLQKRLSSLISCISARWKTTDALIYDKAIIATNPTTQNHVPDQQTVKTNSLLLTPLLRVAPIENASIELPSIDISEYFTGQSICLNAFEARKVIKTKEDEIKKDTEKELEKSSIKSTPITTTITDTDDCIKDDKIKISVDKVVDDAVNIILSLNDNKCDNKDCEIITIDDDIDAGADDDDNNCNNNNDNYEYESVVNNNNNGNNREEKLKKIEEIKRGWTLENCGSLTIGELYLMFGSGSKLILEYTWDDLPQLKQERKDEEEIIGKSIDNSITQSLKKLLSLAKLQYNHCNHVNVTNIGSSTTTPTITTTTVATTTTTIPITTTTTTTTSTISSVATEKCACGHNCCGGSSKNHTQFKKPITSKVIKKNQTYQDVQHNIIEERCNSDQNETQQIVDDETSAQSPNNPVVNLFTQFDIQRLNPLNRNKRRPRSKQWVVERKLVPNKSENKHQIVSMDIVPQEQTIEIVNKSIGVQSNETPNINQNINNNTSDNTAILNDNNKSLNFLDPNQSNSGLSTGSLSEFLKTGDDQWISNDVGDFSLSSLLGRLDYQKTNQSILSNNDSRLSTDVDAQLHTMLIENSIDYTEKFADLAAQVTDKK